MDDPFNIAQVTKIQQKVLNAIQDDPDDIMEKIAALRAAADLLQQAASIAMIRASFVNAMGKR